MVQQLLKQKTKSNPHKMQLRTDRKAPTRFVPEAEVALFSDDFAEEEHDEGYDYMGEVESDVSSEGSDDVEFLMEVEGLVGGIGQIDLTASDSDADSDDGASDQLYKLMSKNEDDDESYVASDRSSSSGGSGSEYSFVNSDDESSEM
jgi:hypothetical protein